MAGGGGAGCEEERVCRDVTLDANIANCTKFRLFATERECLYCHLTYRAVVFFKYLYK